MCSKEFSYIGIALMLMKPSDCGFELVSTTQQPATTLQDNQQKLLTALDEINSRLGECHKTESFQNALRKQQNSIDDIKKILQNQTKIEEQLKRIMKLEETVEKLIAVVENLKTEKPKILPKNCHEILKSGVSVGGVYTIRPNNSSQAFTVRCDMDTMGGGWTYVLKRYDGSQTFSLGWDAYKKGFGGLDKEFWLGLEFLHQLTREEKNEVLVELVDWDNKQAYAFYDAFKIGNELEGYAIQILGQYSGNAGDSFHNHTYMKFTTKDKDQDLWLEGNCANAYDSGWWYNRCHETQLTGTYFKGNGAQSRGIIWKEFHGYDYSLKEVRMMIRMQQ